MMATDQVSEDRNPVADVAAIAALLAENPQVADELIGDVAAEMSNCADAVVDSIESSIDMGGGLLSGIVSEAPDPFLAQASCAYLDDGGWIALTDYLRDTAEDSVESMLTGYGLESCLASEFSPFIIFECVRYLQERDDLQSIPGDLAAEAWREIESNQDFDGFFNVGLISSETSNRLMNIFGERLESAGRLLFYQAYVDFINNSFSQLQM